MVFLAKILGYRDFSKKEEIKKFIAQSEGISQKEIDKIEGFIFFDTKRQKTWLIASPNNLYCILDDISTEKFKIRWKISKEEIVNDNITNSKDFVKINPNFKENSGRVDFGFHKGWLYSKKLFQDAQQLKDDFNYLITSIVLKQSK